MAQLVLGTPDYADVFGSQAELPAFTSELPEYYSITQAWADPSIRVDLGLDTADSMFSKLARDVQNGSRRMSWALAVPGDANLPLQLFSSVRELVFSQPIPQSITEGKVGEIFNPANRPKGAPGLAGVVIGAALAGIGTAIPIVGQIAGLVVAFASAIFGALKKNKTKKDLQDAKVREELYKLFPPLQVADSATDTQIARRIHALMETGDITSIFMPRFKGSSWVGIERDKGFAFAPGSTVKASDVFGQDQQQFEAAGGIGCIPNSQIITSVIQVNLDPRGVDMERFRKVGYPDPRTLAGAHESVVDTGGFYEAAANQATLAWALATKDRGLQGNGLLYRLNVPRMYAWREYFESGVEYIKDVALPWWGKAGDDTEDAVHPNVNWEGFYATAVARAVVAFAAQLNGGTTLHPIYEVFAKPYGLSGDQMKRKGLYRYSENAGVFLPILNDPGQGFLSGMGTMWDRGPNIKLVLETLAQQQRHDLQFTLASMYVRRSDAAFVDNSDLVERLNTNRRALLKSADQDVVDARRRIVLADIPANEQLDGKPLRDLALAAGVPENPALGGMSPNLRAAPPRPSLPPFENHNLGSIQKSRWPTAQAVAGIGLGLTFATLAWRERRDRARRPA